MAQTDNPIESDDDEGHRQAEAVAATAAAARDITRLASLNARREAGKAQQAATAAAKKKRAQ